MSFGLFKISTRPLFHGKWTDRSSMFSSTENFTLFEIRSTEGSPTIKNYRYVWIILISPAVQENPSQQHVIFYCTHGYVVMPILLIHLQKNDCKYTQPVTYRWWSHLTPDAHTPASRFRSNQAIVSFLRLRQISLVRKAIRIQIMLRQKLWPTAAKKEGFSSIRKPYMFEEYVSSEFFMK
jgi:hypothetical protein